MNKITEQDLANRGVKGLPDVPGLTTEEMQRKLEEIAREILIPKVNELVEGLNNANSNLQTKQDYGKRVVIGSEVAVAPSASAFDNASLTVYAGAGASDARAGIGFHNVGVCGGYLYLGNDGALHFINNNGIDFQINMTQIS